MEHNLKLSMSVIPEVAKRHQHVLILLQNAAGNYLLGAKDIYPENIVRMVGGGMEESDTDPTLAAQRELHEETGLTATPADLKPISTITADLTETTTNSQTTFTTYLFSYNTGTQSLTPSDDLDGIVELTPDQLRELITRYEQLPKEIDPTYGFAWYDYGQIYGRIHQIALEATQHVQSKLII
jgi:8-oxo-dGTP pyrophosphatase MutT (NUDIX family)